MSVKDRGAARKKSSAQDELAELLANPPAPIRVASVAPSHLTAEQREAVAIAEEHARTLPPSVIWPAHPDPTPRPSHYQGFALTQRRETVMKGVTTLEAALACKPFRVRGSHLRVGDVMRDGKVVEYVARIDLGATPGLRKLLEDRMSITEVAAIRFVGEPDHVMFTNKLSFYVVRTDTPHVMVTLAKKATK
jgi:hypothetical protein